MDPLVNTIDKAFLLILLRRVKVREKSFLSLLSQHLSLGHFSNMYVELRKYPNKSFNFTLMSVGTFDELLATGQTVEGVVMPLSRLQTNFEKSLSFRTA